MKIHISLYAYFYWAIVSGLREVRIQTPIAVKKGDNARLYCWYDTEGDPLYIVKWYKSEREFYRYVPQEYPSIKSFPVGNLKIKESESNATQVTLLKVDTDAAGSFSCEVSVDAPSFQTAVVSGIMNVVELPTHRPVISGLRSKYQVNDVLKLNCSLSHSKPAANLTWFINNKKVLNTDTKTYSKENKFDSHTSASYLLYRLTRSNFNNEKLKIRCSAAIYDIYWQSTEVSAEEEKIKPSTVGTSKSVIGINYHQPPPNFQLGQKKLDREIDVKVIGHSGSARNFLQISISPAMLILTCSFLADCPNCI